MELLIFKISSVILAILLGWMIAKYIIVKNDAEFWESMYRDSMKTNKELLKTNKEVLKASKEVNDLNEKLCKKLAQETSVSKDQR